MTLTYIPPNQSLFEANMISAVQALLISLSHIFDSLQMEKQYPKKRADFYMIEHDNDMNSVEYKKWKLEKLSGSFYSTIEESYDAEIFVTEYAPSVF